MKNAHTIVNPFGAMEDYFHQETTTKFGIDKALLMIHFMPALQARGRTQLRKSFDKLQSFICQQIKRGITSQEKIDLCQGIINYVRSDAATNERMDAMNYLFDLKFLKDEE